MPIFERVSPDLPVTLKTTSYTVVEGDNGTEIQFQKTTAITASLPAVSSVANGFNVILRNVGTSNLTVDPAGSETIDGASTATLATGESRWIRADGTEWKSIGGSGGSLALGAGRWNAFLFELINTAGTLQHRFFAPNMAFSLSVPPDYAAGVNGTTTTLNNTPTGPDASTPFTAGAKIGSTNPNDLYLDTADLTSMSSSLTMFSSIVVNSTGTAVHCVPTAISIDINGVTRTRLRMTFIDLSGNGFALNTTNIASGKGLRVSMMGFMPNYA